MTTEIIFCRDLHQKKKHNIPFSCKAGFQILLYARSEYALLVLLEWIMILTFYIFVIAYIASLQFWENLLNISPILIPLLRSFPIAFSGPCPGMMIGWGHGSSVEKLIL